MFINYWSNIQTIFVTRYIFPMVFSVHNIYRTSLKCYTDFKIR